MRRFIEEADRGQSTLLPECLDDFIDQGNPVRVIDVFVEAIDLTDMGFDGVDPAATGRPSYHPSVLLKLYIYGYLNRVQSSRRLEREAGRNVEVMWLLGRLIPDHKTIADFRKDNGLALRKVCARFVELCRGMGLLATASVAIDGSKFKAVNNRDRNFTRAKVERRRAQLMIVAAVGILFGVLAGYLIGQFGIVRPINLLKAVMEAFANNNLKADVPGVDRRDELGDRARTVEVFKKNGLEVERMRADQLVTEKRNAEQRKADMIKLADDFEGAFGEIIETVSSASTELQASAGTLTKTAERAQEITTTVAAASEEASTNVQSVASATEELTSSVNEISRQVQESARMAGEAVDQARKTNDRCRRAVKGSRAHRRRCRIDQHHRWTDQFAGSQRHHRGGARR
jgi:transposase